ncbi:MAG TPA: TraR/DksA C4-type zinc finger protein [Acidimicrobiales bacterium]|nr:TraR/DksA C4-type zinc finger protein [Acidimicrobiales bacterium]
MDDAQARDLLAAEQERLEEIRADLSEEEGDLEDADAQDASEAVDGQHPGDIGTELFERERDLGELEDVERQLREVEDALRRLDEGTYGVCEVCGRPIPDERLEANPTARFDVEHEPRGTAGLGAPL